MTCQHAPAPGRLVHASETRPHSTRERTCSRLHPLPVRKSCACGHCMRATRALLAPAGHRGIRADTRSPASLSPTVAAPRGAARAPSMPRNGPPRVRCALWVRRPPPQGHWPARSRAPPRRLCEGSHSRGDRYRPRRYLHGRCLRRLAHPPARLPAHSRAAHAGAAARARERALPLPPPAEHREAPAKARELWQPLSLPPRPSGPPGPAVAAALVWARAPSRCAVACRERLARLRSAE